VQSLIEIALSNIAMAAALAVVAVLAGRTIRRPALTHSLWLLVLIKLITPPLFFVPMQETKDEEPEAIIVVTPEMPPALEHFPAEALPVLPEVIEDDVPQIKQKAPPEPEPKKAIVPSTPTTEPGEVVDWFLIVGGIWLAGTVCWLLVASTRLGRFRRLLSQAQPVTEDLQIEVKRLAEKFQVRCPNVRLVHGPMSPMIWVLGRMRWLLVPANLLDRLNAQQRAALLAHELAHLRRKDPWVRYLEMIVLPLYWWCPLVWWAVRELREAEEECCDAWVLWALPESGRAYALALVETVDFLAEARPALPVLASGFGHVQLLRRRLTMIMRGTTPRALTASGVVVLLAVAALLVPWLPTWGQGQPPGPNEDPARALRETLQKLQKMQTDLQKQQAALEEQRQALEAKAKELAKALGVQKKEKKFILDLDTKKALGEQAKADAAQKKAAAEKALQEFEKAVRIIVIQQGQGRPDLEKRLAALEMNLTNVLKEVQNIRRELGGGKMDPRFGPRGPMPPGPGGPGGQPGFPPGGKGPVPFPPGGFPPGGPGGPAGGLPGGPGAGAPGGFPQPPLVPQQPQPPGKQ
jgi:beta-lactamase regulating signal transducer with metallopeptidase domain